MLQDLNDLTEMGKSNAVLLESIKFDKTLLDKAVSTSDSLSAVEAVA